MFCCLKSLTSIFFPSVTQLFKKRVGVGQKLLSRDDLVFLTRADPNFVSDEESDEDKTAYRVKSPKWRCGRLSKIMDQCQMALDLNRKRGAEPKSTRARHSYGDFTTRAPPAAEEKQIYVQQGEVEVEEDADGQEAAHQSGGED